MPDCFCRGLRLDLVLSLISRDTIANASCHPPPDSVRKYSKRAGKPRVTRSWFLRGPERLRGAKHPNRRVSRQNDEPDHWDQPVKPRHCVAALTSSAKHLGVSKRINAALVKSVAALMPGLLRRPLSAAGAARCPCST